MPREFSRVFGGYFVPLPDSRQHPPKSGLFYEVASSTVVAVVVLGGGGAATRVDDG